MAILMLPTVLLLVPFAAAATQSALLERAGELQAPTVSFTVRTEQLAGTPQGIVVAPLDADPFPDLALYVGARLSVFRGEGTGKFTLAWETIPGFSEVGHPLRAFDVNADGWVDLSLPGLIGFGALRPGDGSLIYDHEVFVPNVGGTVLDLAFADFTGDGLLDSMTALVDIGGYFLDTAINLGGTSFGFPPACTAIPGFDIFHPHFICEDLDGDGTATDVVISSSSGLVAFEFGSAKPDFTVVPGVFGEAATADLDGDGDGDLIVTMPERGEVRVFFNDGNADFTLSETFETGLLPGHLVVADLEGEGDLDIVVANEGSGTLALLVNDGTGRLRQLEPIRVSSSPSDLEAADLDLDGDVDLVVIDEVDRTLSVLRNELLP